MKKIITAIAFMLTLGVTLYAQPTYEWRLENEQLTSSTTYQFDVVMYNKGASDFEIRGGSAIFMYNTNWLITGSVPTMAVLGGSYGLPANMQTGAIGITTGASAYCRKIITTVGQGVGHTMAAGTKLKMFTLVITNANGFSTTNTPNFAWKFNTSAPYAGWSYSVGSVATVVVSQTVTASQGSCSTPIYWTGSAWNTFSKTTTNTVVTGTPATGLDATIYTGTLGNGALNCRNYKLNTGATHNLGANTLNVGGNMVNNGTLSASTGTLNLVGTSALQTADQTVSGSGSFTVDNLGFGVAANAGTKTLSTGVSVGGSVSQSGTAVLASGGNLTLLSVAGGDGTARINQLTSGAAITGNIRVERYLPASGRRWRFLSSPVVGGTTLQWRNNGENTPGRGILITGGAPAAGFDSSISFAPSVKLYNETSTNGTTINNKWETVNGNSTLVNGLGYRVYVRGDRTISLTTAVSTANATTIWVSGTYPTTPATLPVTYTPGQGNGWNLVGNPFPCPIDWNAAGWTKTNMSGTVWIFNPGTNSYGSYDGTTINNGVSRFIGSGQAFFVQTNGASPALAADESVKVSSTPSNMFKAAEMNTLRIRLTKDSAESDETVIRFMENKSDEFSATDDVVKYAMNANVNISSYFGPEKYAMVNYLKSQDIKTKAVPLAAWVSVNGSYEMKFTQLEDFDANINVFLKDNFNNTLTDLRLNNTYLFNVDSSNAATTVDGRLEVVFVNTNTSIEDALAGMTTRMEVYPNPVKDVLNVELFNTNFKQSTISIYNVSGQEVMSGSMIGKNKKMDVQNLSSGVYLVKVSNSETGYSNTVKFVK